MYYPDDAGRDCCKGINEHWEEEFKKK